MYLLFINKNKSKDLYLWTLEILKRQKYKNQAKQKQPIYLLAFISFTGFFSGIISLEIDYVETEPIVGFFF